MSSSSPQKLKRVSGYLADDGEFFTKRSACAMHNARRALANSLLEAGFDPDSIIPLVISLFPLFADFIATHKDMTTLPPDAIDRVPRPEL